MKHSWFGTLNLTKANMLVSLLRLISDLDDFAKKPVLDFREAQSGLTVLGVEIVQFIHPLLDAGP